MTKWGDYHDNEMPHILVGLGSKANLFPVYRRNSPRIETLDLGEQLSVVICVNGITIWDSSRISESLTSNHFSR